MKGERNDIHGLLVYIILTSSWLVVVLLKTFLNKNLNQNLEEFHDIVKQCDLQAPSN